MPSEIWIVNASPVITMAKAGHLSLFEQLAPTILIPEAVATEILAAPASDPARKAIENGWGRRIPSIGAPSSILEWGLGSGESAVLAATLEIRNSLAVLDDAAARKCARALNVPLMGTLGAVLRARRLGLIPAAAQVVKALRDAGLRLDDETIRISLWRAVGERWD